MSTPDQRLPASNSTHSQEVLRFIEELIPGGVDRRSAERLPFIQPATIYFDDEPQLPIPVLTRDVSHTGIGFTHDVPVHRGEATVRMTNAAGQSVCARIDIRWYRSLRPFVYISGARFLRAYTSDPVTIDRDPIELMLSELLS